MNIEVQTKAYQLIEAALNDGHNLDTLPLPRGRAVAIVQLREQATEQDIQRLEATLGLNLAPPTIARLRLLSTTP